MEIINCIIEELNEEPFIFDHSLDGLTVIRYAETRPDKVRGVVASSSALAKTPKTPSFIVALAKILGKITPSLTLSNGIDPNLLSRNPETAKRYIEDLLVHGKISTKLGISLFNNINAAHTEAQKIKFLVLLLISTDDIITLPGASRRLFEELAVKGKTLKEFEGTYHEIFEDPKWGRVS